MTVASRRLLEHKRRREQILNAAKKLFDDKGFDSTTVEEVAFRAELGKGTIYSYFKSKEEIYVAIMEKELEILEERMEAAVARADSAIAALYSLYDTFINYHRERRGFIETLFVQADQQVSFRLGGMVSGLKNKAATWRMIVGKVLRAGIAGGELRRFDVNIMSHVVIGIIIGIIIQQASNQNVVELDEYRKTVFALVLEGLKKA